MKIPEQIRIGGIEYQIVHESRMNDGRVLLAGQIRHMECQIALAEECSHEYKCLSLWHEIMHGIEEQSQIARGVYQVLQDNGRRLYDLAEEEVKK